MLSAKVENYCYAIALHFVYNNFAKFHKSLSDTPAMQAGLIKRVVSIEDIAMLADIKGPKKRGRIKESPLPNNQLGLNHLYFMDREKLIKTGFNLGAIICAMIMIKLQTIRPPQYGLVIFFLILGFVLRWIATRD